MSLQVSLPLLLSLLALFIADENSELIKLIYRFGISYGNRASVESRLAKIGKNEISDFENFRIYQLVIVGTGLTLSALFLFIGIFTFSSFLFLAILISVISIVTTDRNLSKRVLRRKEEIESEFPAIVEMLTLAVGAGESPAAAVKRIAQRADGHISNEFQRVVFEVEKGAPFTAALDSMSRRINSVALRRFVDSLIISIARGTPLVETLSHGVKESRNQERVRLLTAAGKSEISMMIPVVFLILPVSILFALYPSLTNLNLFTS